jgi:hypothetical protein
MTKRSVVRAIVVVIAAFMAGSTSVAPASASWEAGQIFVTEWFNGVTLTLDVDSSDSIENVRQKIQEKTSIDPRNMCLAVGGRLLQDGRTLNDYSVQPEDVVQLVVLPVIAAWSVTPAEPFLGATMRNVPVLFPGAARTPSLTHAAVVSGTLPEGVKIDEATGQIEGLFTQVGPFDVTIRVDTFCGSADLRWSGDVRGQLPDTGRGDATLAVSAGIGALTLLTGIALIAIRSRRTGAN